MKSHLAKLKELQEEMKSVIKAVESGKINHAKAADRITEIREHMDNLIENIKQSSKGQM